MSKTGKTGSPFASGNRDAVRRHPPFVRTGLTFAALGLFVTAAALAVVKPSSHDEPPGLSQASQALALPDPFPEPLNHFYSPFVTKTLIRRGNTLEELQSPPNVHATGVERFLNTN